MYFVNVRAILMTAILTHVDQVTDLVRVGWTEEAVPQVSVPQFHRCQFSPIRYQWGGMNHCYVGSVFLRFSFLPALGSMWEAPDVSIRPSQTKFVARIESWSSVSEISISSKSKTTRKYKISE